MSELKTNKISTNDQNNVAIDNALGLKSYTTAQRDALTSVAGDMIYNSDDNKVQVYTGSAWEDVGSADPLQVSYLVIAGGGGSAGARGGGSGGGGAGGYINSYASENSGGVSSTAPKSKVFLGQNYTVTVGAGGSGGANAYNGTGGFGSDSQFDTVVAIGGGGGGGSGEDKPESGGSGGGQGAALDPDAYNNGAAVRYHERGKGAKNQGKDGGYCVRIGTSGNIPAGGGGGSGGTGGSGSGTSGGNGGAGTASSITGSSVTRAGGGGGGGFQGPGGTGQGGGGNGKNSSGSSQGSGSAGTVNTGGGGGGGTSLHTNAYSGRTGGSGIVILRYSNAYSITVGAGLTAGTETTDGSDKYIEITAGTGSVSWA